MCELWEWRAELEKLVDKNRLHRSNALITPSNEPSDHTQAQARLDVDIPSANDQEAPVRYSLWRYYLCL
jgi:hypothetical protein